MSFRDYIHHGWKLCAIPPGAKAPRQEEWNRRENAHQTGIALTAGAGLLHAWSGTCAIDIDKLDTAREWLATKGIDLYALLAARDAVQITSGREGRAKLLYALPAPLPSLKVAPYQKPHPETGKLQTYHALEFRCATKDGLSVQDVLPPTIHPETGKPYAWKFHGDDLIGDWRNLPPLPAELLALWQANVRPPAQTGPVAPVGAEYTELQELLEGEDPDSDYDTWLAVGLAIHHETSASPQGFALWDAWSAKGSKYKGRQDLEPHWRSFRSDANNPITIGWLRSRQVAKADAFPIVVPAQALEFGGTGNENFGEDTRPGSVIRKILETRLVFVTGQDCYYDLESKSDGWLTDRSVRHLFCPRMPLIEMPGKSGKPDKVTRPDPVDFLKNSETKTVVDAVGMHPGAPRLYTEDKRRYVNRYMPRPVEPLHPKSYELEAFQFLWSRMVEPMFREWLLRFFAHAVQHPGVKIRTAPLLFSEATGTGKNTLMKELPEILFGSQWVRTMSGNVLGSNFNDAVGETWWLYLEELRTGASKADRIQMTNKIKAWVTDSSIEVHPKGLKPYNIRNRMQITGSSNFNDALQLDNHDRRWAVGELGDPWTERESIDLYAFLHSERARGVLHHIFRGVDLLGFKPDARAPVTVAKKAMIRAGIGTWESEIVERMVASEPPFDKDLFSLREAYQLMIGRGPLSQHALGAVIRKPPFNCALLPNFSKARLWAWRNVESWMRTPEGARMRYMETGQRPEHGRWTNEIPLLLLAMSADAEPEEPKPFAEYPEHLRDLI